MKIWEPEPGETLLTRAYVRFAAGADTTVHGMRWFRDSERRDITGELTDWPEGPVYTAHSENSAQARNTGKGFLAVAGALILGALSLNTESLLSVESGASRTSDDPENEINDFPVLWAAPGAVARTLPWQLDSDRVDHERYRTHLAVTDRRLLFLGTPYSGKAARQIEDHVLWEVARDLVQRVELPDYRHLRDFRIVFTDGSWCRLRATPRAHTVRFLSYPYELIELDQLPPGVLTTLEGQAEANRQGPHESLFVARRPCGHFLAVFPVKDGLTATWGLRTRSVCLAHDGTVVSPQDYHPGDL
ncbi:hypothetical protein AB0J21_04890 [Streptomyces sp. NPDC049954]|uniref:hypothetical protein n=1 Tax=Streptomyces sp. NPDC049954 TaxID=3155779 RepID=UPI00343B46BD